MNNLRWGGIVDWLLAVSVAVALASCGVAVYAAWHWPLVGDAALMRYVVLLLHAGYAPYRQIIDINLPGSYLAEALAMRTFGAGALGLRLYDGSLCALAVAGAVLLGERGSRGRACGLLAGILFVLIHLRDGVVEGGERDLLMAVLAVLGYFVLLRLAARNWRAGVVIFELLIGVTLTIKPTLLPLAALPVLLSYFERRYVEPHWVRARAGTVLNGLAALLVPGLLVLFWLHHHSALAAFVAVLRSVDVAHSRLAHQGLPALLAHSVAPIPLVFCLVVLLAMKLRPWDGESKLLLAGAAWGLLSFVVQGKGFPYQRYPFLLFALIWIARLIARALASQGWPLLVGSALAVLVGLVLPPVYALSVASYTRSAPFEAALGSDLSRIQAVQGSVQCLDTVGGCINTLLDLHLRQSTGFLYDCYAYEGRTAEQQRYRSALLGALVSARPQTIVLTNQFCLDQHYSFDRVAQWPELEQFLDRNYRQNGGWEPGSSVRWWHQPETPPAYRLFSLQERPAR